MQEKNSDLTPILKLTLLMLALCLVGQSLGPHLAYAQEREARAPDQVAEADEIARKQVATVFEASPLVASPASADGAACPGDVITFTWPSYTLFTTSLGTAFIEGDYQVESFWHRQCCGLAFGHLHMSTNYEGHHWQGDDQRQGIRITRTDAGTFDLTSIDYRSSGFPFGTPFEIGTTAPSGAYGVGVPPTGYVAFPAPFVGTFTTVPITGFDGVTEVWITMYGSADWDDICLGAGITTDLAVTKRVNNPRPDFGDTITFTVKITNNGPDDADDVEVTDVLPAGLTFVNSTPTQGGYNAGTGVWSVGALAVGDMATLTINATVNTLDPVTNTATLTASTPDDSDPSNNSASATVTPQAADLSIDKTVDNDAPAVGEEVTFTITISHLDGGDVASVRVEDQIPAGTSFVGATTTQGSYNAGSGVWQVGAMTEGQMETLLLTVTVNTTAPVTNTANIAFANLPDPFPGDNRDSASLNAVAADLEVTKSVTAFSTDNGTVTATYLVTVSNEGPSATGGVVVTDNLSPDMSLVSVGVSQGGVAAAPPVLTWTLGTLADGGSATMTVTVTVPGGGSLLNTAEVTAADLPDPDSEPGDGEGDDFAATSGPRTVPDFVPGGGPGGVVNRGDRFTADLALTKDVTVEGDNAIYTVMVENLGPQSTAKVEVTDHLPDCLTYVSSSADRGAYDPGTWIWTVGELKVGEKVTVEIVTDITADCAGEVVNTATVTSSSLPDPSDFFTLFDDPATANNSDDASFTVTSNGRVLDGTQVALGVNYPNPFNPTTLIPFSLKESTQVSIKVYDLLGRTVATLVDGAVSQGLHEVRFEAGHLPTGMYLVRMEAGGLVQTQRITLMK